MLVLKSAFLTPRVCRSLSFLQGCTITSSLLQRDEMTSSCTPVPYKDVLRNCYLHQFTTLQISSYQQEDVIYSRASSYWSRVNRFYMRLRADSLIDKYIASCIARKQKALLQHAACWCTYHDRKLLKAYRKDTSYDATRSHHQGCLGTGLQDIESRQEVGRLPHVELSTI